MVPTPTPPAPAWMRTFWPGCRLARSTSACQAVEPAGKRSLGFASVALGAHVQQDGLGHAQGAEHVDVVDALRLGDRDLLGGAVGAEAGVVDQHVDAPNRGFPDA